jgi:hypothetical protein
MANGWALEATQTLPLPKVKDIPSAASVRLISVSGSNVIEEPSEYVSRPLLSAPVAILPRRPRYCRLPQLIDRTSPEMIVTLGGSTVYPQKAARSNHQQHHDKINGVF